MKRKIKDILAALAYWWYVRVLREETVKVHTIDETLDELIHTDKSLVRFGDGEIIMIQGKNLKLQKASAEIGEGLKRILAYEDENLCVSVQGIFDGMELYHANSRQFWKDHLLFFRKVYKKYCNPQRVYCDTAVTRCYYAFADKSPCQGWFDKFKKVWDNKKVVVVEGTRSHNGVGNDLFATAASVERILCPPSDAYGARERIVEACKEYDTSYLFLISAGVAAKFITEELFLAGYRVIDIGNLDMEYEWFLSGATGKQPVAKHEIVGEEANRAAGYTEYLAQIKRVVE